MTPLQIKVLEALRSGRYAKRRGRMRAGCTYCAQGVIADVLLQEGLLKGEWVEDLSVNSRRYGERVPMALELEDGSLWQYGMTAIFNLIPELSINDGLSDAIIGRNDEHGESFHEIASWLETVWSMP